MTCKEALARIGRSLRAKFMKKHRPSRRKSHAMLEAEFLNNPLAAPAGTQFEDLPEPSPRDGSPGGSPSGLGSGGRHFRSPTAAGGRAGGGLSPEQSPHHRGRRARRQDPASPGKPLDGSSSPLGSETQVPPSPPPLSLSRARSPHRAVQ